ncbi:MAG: hypothetical protein WCG81_19810 [Candidatus Angelobacter sp.]
MEPGKAQQHDFGRPLIPRVNSVLVPVVATALICLEVVLHWRAYDLISKFMGTILVLNLGTGLWVIFKKPGKDDNQRLVSMAQIAYASLILATMLFTR